MYDDLCRAWRDLLVGLPPIDGWTVTFELPDIDAVGQMFLDYAEIGELPDSAWELAGAAGRELAEYRYRLHRARRRAIRERLRDLTGLVDTALAQVVASAPPSDHDQCAGSRVTGPHVERVVDAVREIERLVGDTMERRGAWADLHRSLDNGRWLDWLLIADALWPGVREGIADAVLTDIDPLPVPDIDLGEAATGHITGAATAALAWKHLDDDGFERLLYDLLRSFPAHENVQWLTHTRAPDRGRDLSLDRVLSDATGGVRRERVIVQAKHWLTRSVDVTALAGTVAAVKLWEPPIVRGLIIVTSGRFSADAVNWAEQHNDKGTAPLIELWPENRLETLLARRPYLAAAHGLR